MTSNAELWIAGCSVVVALCALGATFWHGAQTRKHNKLSVRPLLTCMEAFEGDGKHTESKIELINSGFGPAIIKDFILLYDGQEVAKNDSKKYDAFLRKIAKDFNVTEVVSFRPGSSILAHESCIIFSFIHKANADISFLEKLNLQVNYQSIYQDEVFKYDARKDHQHNELGKS